MTSETHLQVAELIARSHRLGSDRRNTNYAGGRRVVVECRPDGQRLCKGSCRRGDCNQTPKTLLRGELPLR
jgi:hypothetical protein